MIKYRFSYDSKKNIIDVQTLTKEHKLSVGKFECLSCGCEMIAVLGNKRVKHFRHKVITEINCSSETYLHKLAKLKFLEIYKYCLKYNKPFNIEILIDRVCDFNEIDFLQVCQLEPQRMTFDLTKYFQKVFLECQEGSFIPDVLLESKNQEKIFFEVAVTHTSSQDKISSGYRLIEFLMESEEDIKTLESCLLKESEKIRFLNFKKLHKKGWCEGKCNQGIVPYAKEQLLYLTFLVYKNGKSTLVTETLGEIDSYKNNLLYWEYISLSRPIDYSSVYRQKIVEIYQKGLKIKNCFLCRYHAVNTSCYAEGTIFCKFLKKAGNSNLAANCQYFKPDSKVFLQYQF